MKTANIVKLYKYMKIGAIVATVAIPIAMAIATGDPKRPTNSPFYTYIFEVLGNTLSITIIFFLNFLIYIFLEKSTLYSETSTLPT